MKPEPIRSSVASSARFSSREIVGWLGSAAAGDRQGWIVAQRVEIVGIFIAGCDRRHPRRDHLGIPVPDQQRVAGVGQRTCDHIGDVEVPGTLAQHDQAAIGREVAAILTSCERLARDG